MIVATVVMHDWLQWLK